MNKYIHPDGKEIWVNSRAKMLDFGPPAHKLEDADLSFIHVLLLEDNPYNLLILKQ